MLDKDLPQILSWLSYLDFFLLVVCSDPTISFFHLLFDFSVFRFLFGSNQQNIFSNFYPLFRLCNPPTAIIVVSISPLLSRLFVLFLFNIVHSIDLCPFFIRFSSDCLTFCGVLHQFTINADKLHYTLNFKHIAIRCFLFNLHFVLFYFHDLSYVDVFLDFIQFLICLFSI